MFKNLKNWFGAIFGITLAVAYIYFADCMYFIFTKYVNNELPKFIEKVCCMEFNSDFLMAIFALYGAILAFFIPYNRGMIQELSKEFGSNELPMLYRKEKEVDQLLPHLLWGLMLSGLILIGTLLIKQDILFNILSVLLFLHFIVILVNLFKLNQTIDNYHDIDWVLRRANQQAMSTNEQTVLIENIKLFKILEKQIEQEEEYRVIENLKHLDDLAKHLFQLPKVKFESLLISSSGVSEKSTWFDNANYSLSFNALMDVYKRIYRKSMKINSIQIMTECNLYWDNVLDSLIEKPQGRETFLDIYFKTQEELFHEALTLYPPLAHPLGYHWYGNHIFNWYDTESIFNLELLTRYDKELFTNIKYAIDNNHLSWFKGWISWLYHGIGCNDLNTFDPYSYFYFGLETDDCDEISQKFENIYTHEQLQEFLVAFEKLQKNWEMSNTNDNIPLEEKQIEYQEICKKAERKYLFANIRSMLIGIMSYALFRQKYEFIAYTWNFNNPKDANGQNAGHEVLVITFQELFSFWTISTFSPYVGKFGFRDEHSENPYYNKHYFLLTMARLIQKGESFTSFEYSIKEDEKLRIKYYAQGLKEFLNKDNNETFENILCKIQNSNKDDTLRVKLNEQLEAIINAN